MALDKGALQQIPEKAGRLLYIFLFLFCLLALRLWHVGVRQHEKKFEEAFHPRKKVVIEQAPRGTIRDRFNVILADNTIEYRLLIVYADIRKIPSVIGGKKSVKKYPRKEYIGQLAHLIAETAKLDAERIEDLIHSTAAMYDTIPLLLHRDLSETQYYILRAKMKDYPGLLVEAVPKRVYPLGKVASHVVGYMGRLPKAKFDALYVRLRHLSTYVKAVSDGLDVPPPEELGILSYEEAKSELQRLKEQLYSINDSIGLAGIEASCEQELRGYLGKRYFFSDAKGTLLRPLPGSHAPLSGKRVYLTISSELERYAEELLIASEEERLKQKKPGVKEPFVKGGAIIAIEPATGEVIAMASNPRFDPNDFQKVAQDEVRRLSWLENEQYSALLWDGGAPFIYEKIDDEKKAAEIPVELSWKKFLELLLPIDSPLPHHIGDEVPIRDIVVAEKAFYELLLRCPTLSPKEVVAQLVLQKPKENVTALEPYLSITKDLFAGFTSVDDVLLYLDLGRMVVQFQAYTPQLMQKKGDLSIERVRKAAREYAFFTSDVRQKMATSFRKTEFKKWRECHEKEYLQKMRKIEREKKEAARPYLEYIDAMEAKEFQRFWADNKEKIISRIILEKNEDFQDVIDKAPTFVEEVLLLDSTEAIAYLKSLVTFQDLSFSLYGSYQGVDGFQGKKFVMCALKAFGGMRQRSYAFRESSIQGSIFKLVTAYAGLHQAYNDSHGKLSEQEATLFEITDKSFAQGGKSYVGYFPDGDPIPKLYKGGAIPKSMRSNFGHMDLVHALAVSSNVYFALLAGDFLRDPDDLAKAAKLFGYGKKTGIFLPGELSGSVPSDLRDNRTGLYATAIGQHTLVTTPLQTSMMLATIANKGTLYSPKIVRYFVGEELPYEQTIRNHANEEYAFKKALNAVGINFPLFSSALSTKEKEVVEVMPYVQRTVDMEPSIRNTLLRGMKGSIDHVRENSVMLEKVRQRQPELYSAFQKSQSHFVGKTSTAEVMERVGIEDIKKHNHIWFGGISFDDSEKATFSFYDSTGKPELVVVVYLRFGGYGKDVAPLAAAVCEKWRELKAQKTQ